MKVLKSVALFALLLFIGFACTHDESESEEPNIAEITINTPTDNGIFKEGETIFINIDAVGKLPLHDWHLKIVSKASNTTVFEQEGEVHKTNFHLETKWVAKTNVHTDMDLLFTVELDHEGNEETKKVTFHCYN